MLSEGVLCYCLDQRVVKVAFHDEAVDVSASKRLVSRWLLCGKLGHSKGQALAKPDFTPRLSRSADFPTPCQGLLPLLAVNLIDSVSTASEADNIIRFQSKALFMWFISLRTLPGTGTSDPSIVETWHK